MNFIDLAQRLSPEELVKFLNTHLELRMFLVGHTITAADIIVLVHTLEYFNTLSDYEKVQLPHAFRWIDHIQHLPDMFELVNKYNLFVSFPDESKAEPPSKS